MKPFLLILLTVGLIWLRSSLGKLSGGTFVQDLGETLTKVTPKNPHPWFRDFLTSTVIPNSQVFATLVLTGEFLSAVLITTGALGLLLNPRPHKLMSKALIAGLVIGAFLNITFWLGFGYTSASTDSLNLLMAVIQIIGAFYVLKGLKKA
ncbi:hypothetical protein HYU45_03855 [Candidatus Daviesbacteria bacterium]|nr:hypothetical protein [Candidatus Daviesbacteria bacterium]